MDVLWASHRRTLLLLRTDEESLQEIRRIRLGRSEGYRAKEEAWEGLDDEEIIRLVAEPHVEFLNAVAKTLAGDMSYQQRYVKLEELVEGLTEDSIDDPAVIGTG